MCLKHLIFTICRKNTLKLQKSVCICVSFAISFRAKALCYTEDFSFKIFIIVTVSFFLNVENTVVI